MTSAQILIASLRSELSVAQRQCNDPNCQQQKPGGPGRGGDQHNLAVRARGGGRRQQNVLGTVDNDVDGRLTCRGDPNRLSTIFFSNIKIF